MFNRPGMNEADNLKLYLIDNQKILWTISSISGLLDVPLFIAVT